MKKKFLALGLAAAMMLSLVGCTEEEVQQQVQEQIQQQVQTVMQTATPTPGFQPVKTEVAARESSIDFEDGNSAFALISNAPNGADMSDLYIEDRDGNKVLYAKNKGAGKMYLGIDLQALLGDRITDVRKIALTVGVDNSTGKFSASEGKIYLYAGEASKKAALGDWTVFTASKNPKDASFDIAEGTFVAGAGNYMVVSKENSQKKADTNDMFLDNIGFYDADGKVIPVDTTAVMKPAKDFLVEEEEDYSKIVVKLDDSYAGDWTANTAIPASELAKFEGDVTFTYKYELLPGFDYYVAAPKDAWWARRAAEPDYVGETARATAEEGEIFHVQSSDGSITITDRESSELTLTFTEEFVQHCIEHGGLDFMVYGIQFTQVTMSGNCLWTGEKVSLDEAYAGDWTANTAIPANVLAGFEGDLSITYKYELLPGFDYYVAAPKDAWWARRAAEADYVGETARAVAEEGEIFHVQSSDGSITITNRESSELTLTFTEEFIQHCIEHGGLDFMVYGIQFTSAVVRGKSGKTVTAKVALDEAYAGDWTADTAIPVDVLAKFNGDVTITYEYELLPGFDYYVAAPKDAWWARRAAEADYVGETARAVAEEGEIFHVQSSDGSITITDKESTSLTLTFTKDFIKHCAEHGGLDFMVYGIQFTKATLKGPKANIVKVKAAGDEAYVGDWTPNTAFPAESLAQFDEDITVTIKYELLPGFDYYIIHPMNPSWAKATADDYVDQTPAAVAAEGEIFHVQTSDSSIVITDKESSELTFKLSKNYVPTLVSGGGLCFMVYGVVVNSYEVSGLVNPVITEKAAGDGEYAGDWGATALIPADVLAKFSSDVTVTVKMETIPGHDYYLWGPMNASWGPKSTEIYVNFPVKAAAEDGYDCHLQQDGFIVIDNAAATELTFTLTAEAVKNFAAEGGLMGQTFGVQVSQYVLTGK